MRHINDLPASWKRKGAQVVLLSVSLGVVLTLIALLTLDLDNRPNNFETAAALEIERCQSLGYKGVVLSTGDCMNPAPKQVTVVKVTVLSVTRTEVRLRVDGKTFKLSDDKLKAWNANQLVRFGSTGPELRKSQISEKHYNWAIKKFVPVGDLI